MPTSMDCAQARAVYRDRNVRPPRTCQVYPVRRESEPTRENVAVPTPNAPADLSIASLVSKCDGGDGNACFIAGDHLYEGEGVEMNHVRGAALEKRACELNVKDACVSVALHYVNGDGMPRAPERAFQMLLRGCDEDWPMACEALGQAFEGGWGTPKNGANALAAFRKACRLDPAHGCDALKGVTK